MKNKKLIITVLMMASILIVLMPKSNAVLNSNGSTPLATRPVYWIAQIRELETLGGGMGLTETLNEDLSSSSGSNNIDVHMEKNTEYGALAILTVSSYGNPNTVETNGTSTGNETGVMYGSLEEGKFWTGSSNGWINCEAVASAFKSTSDSRYAFSNVNLKYVNIYEIDGSNHIYKIGDATDETRGWQNTKEYQWSGNYFESFHRGKGSIFGFSTDSVDHQQNHAWARAAVVCGEGI